MLIPCLLLLMDPLSGLTNSVDYAFKCTDSGQRSVKFCTLIQTNGHRRLVQMLVLCSQKYNFDYQNF